MDYGIESCQGFNTAKNPELWPNSGFLRPDLYGIHWWSHLSFKMQMQVISQRPGFLGWETGGNSIWVPNRQAPGTKLYYQFIDVCYVVKHFKLSFSVFMMCWAQHIKLQNSQHFVTIPPLCNRFNIWILHAWIYNKLHYCLEILHVWIVKVPPELIRSIISLHGITMWILGFLIITLHHRMISQHANWKVWIWNYSTSCF